MSRVSEAIGRVFSGAARSFARYPAAMFSALIVAISSSVLIYINSSDYERVFSNLMLAFAASAIWGMAIAALSERLFSGKLAFLILNIMTLFAGSGLFAYLYLTQTGSQLPILVTARILASALAAFIIFLLVISSDPGRSDYNQSAFMVLKSFLIALLYGVVIMLGLFFVAFTVKSLIYKDLSEDVFAYIATWSVFLGFAFFLGYFPKFRRDTQDPRLDVAQKHPAFIEILFAFVLIPIMFILTIVLLIWAIQILIVGEWQDFNLLATIFTAYSMFGIFLWIMVSHYTQSTAVFFRRVFPFSALVFLAFEAYTIYRQTVESGIKTPEYFICLLWIFASLSIVVLMINKPVRTRLIGWVGLVLTILAVLPFVGYQAVPVASQTTRLQAVLIKNDMIVDGSIVTAPSSISLADKIVITDAATFLMRDDYTEVRLAPWLAEKLDSSRTFSQIFGFDQTYSNNNPDETVSKEIYLYLPPSAIDISGYNFCALNINDISQPIVISGSLGEYSMSFKNAVSGKIPSFSVSRDSQLLLEQDFTSWIDELALKYDGAGGKKEPEAADMTYKLSGEDFSVMIAFQSIDIMIDAGGKKQVYLYPVAVYLGEAG